MHIKEAGCGDLCEREGFLETLVFDILYFLKYWICVSMPSFVKEKKKPNIKKNTLKGQVSFWMQEVN